MMNLKKIVNKLLVKKISAYTGCGVVRDSCTSCVSSGDEVIGSLRQLLTVLTATIIQNRQLLISWLTTKKVVILGVIR
ncbi:hypothetical protein [Lentilactobacillus fungorum]|uniref:hypothetical protein n=1 Tax=Lentilactobacillus fungorum TaxID=2201250 RepID=UPI00194518CF|nr:hypothetical protein [Lentilactobacillus fungorum]